MIGTVKGDIHDIGKNLVAMMLEGAGFEVFDLGINTDADKFLAALDEHKPDILGMSALLTTTMPYMKVVIQTLMRARASATTTSCSSAARRSTRSSARRSAPTPTAATRRSRPRPRRRSSTSAVPASPERRAATAGRAAARHRLRRARPRAACVLDPAAGFAHVDVDVPAGQPPQPARADPGGRPRARSGAAASRLRPIFVAYADCGTGGVLDAVLEAEGVERLPARTATRCSPARDAFAALADEELGTFYLTDFLARHFDRSSWRGLGLDRHPELLPIYFGNYRRLVYLAQTDDPDLTARARRGGRPARARRSSGARPGSASSAPASRLRATPRRAALRRRGGLMAGP